MIKEYSSFRDPCGFIYKSKGQVYRHINYEYQKDYDFAYSNGIYKELMDKKYLIGHQEVNKNKTSAYKILKVENIDFISYPYEWSFSEYKDAALLTLKIQKRLLLKGMTLKDASAYNIQFRNGKPILIDTLSFEILDEKKPWVAYKQFCQHFLAPLALMYYKDERMNCLMKNYIDGIPIDLASELLPKIIVAPTLWFHIHFNALFQNYYKLSGRNKNNVNNMNLKKHILLVESLYNTISSWHKKTDKTEWKDYYSFTNYDKQAFSHKSFLVESFLNKIPKKNMIWDIGANNGHFSRIAAKTGANVISFDIDTEAVDENYKIHKSENYGKIFPLLFDVLNPSPSIGWANKERLRVEERAKPDAIMALALIHHLSISNNIPFEYIADYFSTISKYLIIEFVPKEDSQIQFLLSSRKDIFKQYNQKKFEDSFKKFYNIIASVPIKNSRRIMYLMSSKTKR